MNNIDYTLYFITNRDTLNKNYNVESSVEEAILGGATVVQLREKELETKEFYEIAKKIKKICNKYDIPLIINDRMDIAMAIDADGVHVGQDDMPMTVIRSLLGKDKIIGVSATTYEEAVKAYEDGADYLGVGAMFNTNTKSVSNTTSFDTLKKIKKDIPLPVVVIGGINENTIPEFKNMYIDGLSIISAITSKENIRVATKNLKELYYNNYPINCGIFDLDGTLFDSLPIWDNCLVKYLALYGKKPDDFYRESIWSMEIYEALDLAKKHFNIDQDLDDMYRDWDDMMIKEYNENISLFDGAIELLEYFYNKNIPMAIATALPIEYFDNCLEKYDMKKYFTEIHSVHDDGKNKNEKYIFEKIAKNLNINPKECIVFEDSTHSLYGIKSAQMQSCLISGGKSPTEQEKRLIDLNIDSLKSNKLYEYLNKK